LEPEGCESAWLGLPPRGESSSPEPPWNGVVGVAAVLKMSANLKSLSSAGFVGLASVSVPVAVRLEMGGLLCGAFPTALEVG